MYYSKKKVAVAQVIAALRKDVAHPKDAVLPKVVAHLKDAALPKISL